MKRKNILFALTLTLLLVSGCGQQQSQMKYIGAETAKQVALEASGLSSSETQSVIADLTSKNGTDYYQVDLTAAGESYSYDIDALTGVVIESRTLQSTQSETLSADVSSASQAETLNADAASASDAAQAEIPGADAANASVTSQAETPNANAASASGAAQAKKTESSGAQPSAASTSGTSNNVNGQAQADTNTANGQIEMITADAAKSYALAHAGLTDDQVTFTKSKLDYDDGKQVYDVEFYTGNREEYDYEIDAYSGAVISYDYEIKGSAASSGTSTITEADAKKLALAQVPGAAESDIREFKTDYDDGRMEYEGKILYGGMEYEFEIDAYSGAIRSWETEPAKR